MHLVDTFIEAIEVSARKVPAGTSVWSTKVTIIFLLANDVKVAKDDISTTVDGASSVDS